MKTTLIFVAFVIAVLLTLFLISDKRSPRIPVNDLHKVITDNIACTGCHAPGKHAPLKKDHPPKEQCLLCHKVKKGR